CIHVSNSFLHIKGAKVQAKKPFLRDLQGRRRAHCTGNEGIRHHLLYPFAPVPRRYMPSRRSLLRLSGSRRQRSVIDCINTTRTAKSRPAKAPPPANADRTGEDGFSASTAGSSI